VSIARVLQDPLAELVKIEPKSIGVGQYQHDVNQSELARTLDAVVEDCVNSVGVDLNTASAPLLARVIEKRDQFDHGIRTIIQQGIDQGAFTPGDPKMIEFAMMGAVNWIAKWFDPEGAMTSDQIGEAFANYLVGGLLK